MENNNNKTITVSFMVSAILVGILFSVIMDTLGAVTTGGFNRFVTQDIVRHGIPVLLGFITFIVLQTNSKIHSWADEVTTELKRVVWPSRKDTTAMTIVVCVMVLVSGVVFGLLDVMSGSIIDWLLNRNFLGGL
jgi:preprotein translocase subunit SecE